MPNNYELVLNRELQKLPEDHQDEEKEQDKGPCAAFRL